MENGEKKRRMRNNGTKRWTHEETLLLLNGVKDRIEMFEKPTARVFYKKLQSEIEELDTVQWDTLRHKIRNLRTKYKEAIDWRNSIGASLLAVNKEKSVHDHILKICCHFDLLDEIFGKGKNMNSATAFDSRNIDKFELELVDVLETNHNNIDEESSSSNVQNLINVHLKADQANLKELPTTPHPNESECKDSNCFKRIRKQSKKKSCYSSDKIGRNAIRYLNDIQENKTLIQKEKLRAELEMHRARNMLNKDKIQFEINIQNQKIEIERERLEMEKQKLNEDSRIRLLEIEKNFEIQKAKLASDEKLKIMQLEKENELKKYELELKYKYEGYQVE